MPTVFITGASSGIGRGVALELAKRPGFGLLLTGRDHDRLKETASLCGPTAQFQTADLSLPSDVDRLMEWVMQKCPNSPDIFIFGAGMASLGMVSNLPLIELERSLRVQVLSLAQIAQRFITPWKQRRAGRLVVISSGAAYRGLPGASAYCTGKSAQLSFTESLSEELEPYGIHVCTVSPGLIDSSFHKNTKIFGNLPFDFAETAREDLETGIKRVLIAVDSRMHHLEFSSKGKLARVLGSIAPNFLHNLLTRKMKQAAGETHD